jgi:arylsulfatase A-like enzyme
MRCFADHFSSMVVRLLLFFLCLIQLHAAPPDIILILADDMGYGDLGRHGNPILKTPHLDAFHDESVRLTDFCVSPSCSPTRAALLTGRDPLRQGVTHTLPPREHLDRSAILLPQLLKNADYESCFIGKWHLGDEQGYSAHQRGFDLSITSRNGGSVPFDPTMVRNGGMPELRKGYREDVYFDEAIHFIRKRRAEEKAKPRKPYFLYLASYSPHSPLAAPAPFIAPYRQTLHAQQASYAGMVANLDWNVGRLLNFLKKQGLEKDTIVIFMSDNGGTYGIDLHNAEMRGCKCTVWPGGTRAISLWRWLGQWQPKKVDALTAHLDVVPTLAELAGIKLEPKVAARMEGHSLKQLLEHGEDPWFRSRMLFQHVTRWPGGTAAQHRDSQAAVRWSNYLLIRNRPCSDSTGVCRNDKQNRCNGLRRVMNGLNKDIYTRNALFHWGITHGQDWALYDIERDPGCQVDLAEMRLPVVAKLLPAYRSWWDSVYPEMIAAGGDMPIQLPPMMPKGDKEQ